MILPPNLNLLNLNIEDSFYLALPSFFGSAFFVSRETKPWFARTLLVLLVPGDVNSES